jgi:hypothetical protein
MGLKRLGVAAGIALVIGGSAAPATAAIGPATATRDSESEYVLALESDLDAGRLDLANVSAGDLELLAKYAQVASIIETYSVVQLESEGLPTAGLAAGVAAAATSCYTATSSRTAKGIAGNALYKSWHVGRWCKSGSTVTSASRAEQGWQTYWLGWSGQGLVGGSAKVISNQGRSYSQHAFQFQLGTPWPTQYTQPCTRIRGTATPGHYADYVCGLYS